MGWIFFGKWDKKNACAESHESGFIILMTNLT